MQQKRLATGLLITLLVAAGAGVFTAAPAAIHAVSHGVQALAQALPGWQQVNSSGFGDQQAGEVSALESFNGYLYAGTSNAAAGARIFRSPDGVTWTPVTDPGFGDKHDIAPPAILDLAVFGGQIYATTGRGGNPGQIWRALDGVHWARMVNYGFSNPDTVDITTLAVYNGVLYAGAKNLITGAQIWRSFTGDSNSWTQVAPVTPGSAPAGVTGLAVFDGALYAAVESDAPAQIWFSYGGDWTTAVGDGFGDSNTISTGGMAEFGGYLYVGAGNTVAGAQLWRTNDGATWEQAIEPGFGDPNNQKVEMVFVFQNAIYASVKNVQTGLELWRSTNAVLWERANLDGFGDSNNTGVNWSNATTHFLNQLYVGTSNVVDGGELWRMQQPYGVVLSPDQTKAGLAGQTVTYTLTITNTGSASDSFGLTTAGQTWTSTPSTSLVSLAPASSALFSVAVTIPPGAADQATDSVMVTATSQNDSSKSASAVLTTTSSATLVYGVALSPDQAKPGMAGQNVTYALTVTNTGNVVETVDLLPAGNKWTTTLSSQVVTLAAGGSQAVTITVLIPPTAAPSESDQVSIQATCHHDNSMNDIAILTTVSKGQPPRNYIPLVMSHRPE